MKPFALAALTIFCSLLFLSCGGGGGGVPSSSTGTLKLGLTDASATTYQAIYVTVAQVAVSRDGERWDILSSPNKTVNLLDLVNGVRQSLSLATLATGHYTQVRLILGSTPDTSVNILSLAHPYANYFIDRGIPVQEIELKVPSGLQTGIKIVKGFDIGANQTTELVLDFDAARSIVSAGAGGKWLLKPTVKVLNILEYSIIQGNAGQTGVLVSAQAYDGAAAMPEEKPTVRAATVSDADGNYKLFVEPGSYTLVGYKDGNAPYYKDAKVVTIAGSIVDASFLLAAAETGTVTGNPVLMPGPDQEQ